VLSKRAFLKRLAASGAASLSAGLALAGPLRPSILEDNAAALRGLAAARGIAFGCATSTYELNSEGFVAALSREAAIIVPEYEMKRGVVEPVQGQYAFGGCDTLLRFARTHGMSLRGHPLMWHKRNPAWLEDALASSRNDALCTGYIAAVIRHFDGQVKSWDVVNEAIAPGDGRPDGLRNTPWLKAFGPSYIDISYHAARNADPRAMLVYNDWGCEAGAPWNDRFRAATLEFLHAALGRGVPIDALGLQGHFRAFGTPVDQKKLAAFLDDVKALGLRILVTEHDVDDSGGPSDFASRDKAVADTSRRFLDVMLDNDATIAVLTWGLSDRFLQSDDWRARLAGNVPRMLPLDSDLRKTAMWGAMAAAFAR